MKIEHHNNTCWLLFRQLQWTRWFSCTLMTWKCKVRMCFICLCCSFYLIMLGLQSFHEPLRLIIMLMLFMNRFFYCTLRRLSKIRYMLSYLFSLTIKTLVFLLKRKYQKWTKRLRELRRLWFQNCTIYCKRCKRMKMMLQPKPFYYLN